MSTVRDFLFYIDLVANIDVRNEKKFIMFCINCFIQMQNILNVTLIINIKRAFKTHIISIIVIIHLKNHILY